MKYLMPLALILVLGCTNFAMRSEFTTAELDRLQTGLRGRGPATIRLAARYGHTMRVWPS